MTGVFVTDTHPLVWYITAKFTKLPVKVRSAFDDAVDGRSAIFVPAIVMWELAILVKAGKVRISTVWRQVFLPVATV
jgi:PIN domain nuclease of toxin-antitoxin system